jgi:hypothetical protein
MAAPVDEDVPVELYRDLGASASPTPLQHDPSEDAIAERETDLVACAHGADDASVSRVAVVPLASHAVLSKGRLGREIRDGRLWIRLSPGVKRGRRDSDVGPQDRRLCASMRLVLGHPIGY